MLYVEQRKMHKLYIELIARSSYTARSLVDTSVCDSKGTGKQGSHHSTNTGDSECVSGIKSFQTKYFNLRFEMITLMIPVCPVVTLICGNEFFTFREIQKYFRK